jgi:hypothetical protein
MKHGHVTGTKRDRKPRQAEIDRLRALGEQIQQKIAAQVAAELARLTRERPALRKEDAHD